MERKEKTTVSFGIISVCAVVFMAMTSTLNALDAPLIYQKDVHGENSGYPKASEFTNAIYISSTAQSFNTTCGTVGSPTLVCFYPGSTGNFKVKPNGSGVPTSNSTVTDGSAWEPNLTCRGVGAEVGVYFPQKINGSPFSHFAVWSDTVGNEVVYTCYGRSSN